MREAHTKLKMNVFRSAPFICGMIVPLLFADFSVSLYQAVCFPIYQIAKARRRDYIVFDHQHLAYLNFFEKFHCLYCSYANGLLAYAREIVARTEQYFCPIKHAHRILQAHQPYRAFLAHGEADKFHSRLEEFRAALARAMAAEQAK